MKKILLMLMTLLSVAHAEQLKLTIEGSLYYIDKKHDKEVKEIYSYTKNYGGFNEYHSTKERLKPGGLWNLEIKLKKENVANVRFWFKDKKNPELLQDFDVSTLANHTVSLLNNEEGELQLTIIPRIVKEDKLKPIQVSKDSFGLNHMCFKNSAMIINDNFYIGKLTGFGEWTQLRMTNFYDIDVSLMPLKDWKPIGIYRDGIIKIDVDDDNILELLSIGIGPSGYQKGGPFIVYGKIVKNSRSKEEHLKQVEKHELKNLDIRAKTIILKGKQENPFQIEGLSIGSFHSLNEYLKQAIGDIFTGQECG